MLGGGTTLLAGCSPLSLINFWTPSATYRASTGIDYGRHVRNRLDVYRPAEQPGPAPVVVFFYGGNWDSGDRGDYLFVGEALASKGFVAVLPDYRLYPEVRFPRFLEDCAQAVRWTFEHIAAFGGDPQRVFLMGHSAGAYNAAMLALDQEYLRAAGVDPRRVRGLVGLAGPYDFLPIREPVSRLVFGYPDTPIATQPIHFASSTSPPALLATGKDDDVVDPGNGPRLAARLRENGAQARLIVYPDLGHRTILGALASPLRGLAPVLDDVAGFVNEVSAVRG
ncbi:MAG TPA: alpha/beta hydrolase [Burkholderiales bacterium]|nr:alpha/beta hydrolase [Burkholderiales bacterium]